MKASDFVGQFLFREGVRVVFEVIGGMTTHVIDSLFRQEKIEIISTHHEQAAAFAADAMARITGVPGVAFATSGPGAVNLLTGIGSCYFDSTPAVFITGQVNRSEQRGDRPMRQLGFQETNIVDMARPITKAAWQVQDPNELPAVLAEAFRTALSGRPGPTLVDIPMDVQRALIPDSFATDVASVSARSHSGVDQPTLDDLLGEIHHAQRPLLLVGGGLHSSRSAHLIRPFSEAVQVPVIASLMALDALPYSHPLRVGFIGSYGNRWANLAIGEADFLLVLGSRLDIRQTGADTRAFRHGKTIYQVDSDAGEINGRVAGCRPIVCDLLDFLTRAVPAAQAERFAWRAAWMARIAELRAKWPDTAELGGLPGINPNVLMHDISRHSRQAASFVVDVGNHQMWAAQSVELTEGQRFVTSGGMGAMGYALPASIGACLAVKRAPVLMIAGDGGMQVNLQELQTVVHHSLPIKMIVLNNQSYGMVRQFQQSYLEGRYRSTMWGYSAPDFASVARSYGIESATVSDQAEVPEALRSVWEDPHRPYLLQVRIDPSANAYPKIAFGRPITEMEPQFTPVDVEGT